VSGLVLSSQGARMGSCSASVEGDSRLLINSSATDVLRSGNASLCFGPKKLLSLVTFFAWDQSKALKRQLWSTAKKVPPAPGEGRTNRPTRIDPTTENKTRTNRTTRTATMQTHRLVHQNNSNNRKAASEERITNPSKPKPAVRTAPLAYPLQKKPRHQISAAFQKQRNQSHIRQGGNQK